MFAEDGFKGKHILVTGAGSGIGRATAILLGKLGAKVILTGRTLAKLEETAALLPGGATEIVACELCDFASYDEFFQKFIATGKLDGMVHCAGMAKAIPVKALTYESIRQMLDTNLTSFFLLVKYFHKKTISNDNAAIVVCSSVNVHYPQKCMSVYEASKGAVEAAVRGMAEELYSRRHLRVNAMVIGPVATPMAGVANGDYSTVGQFSDITPNLMGIAGPESVAKMAAFLLSDASAYTTGRNFYVDGGRL